MTADELLDAVAAAPAPGSDDRSALPEPATIAAPERRAAPLACRIGLAPAEPVAAPKRIAPSTG